MGVRMNREGGNSMNKTVGVIVAIGLLACVGTYLLVSACDPYPYCEYEDCFDGGEVCRFPLETCAGTPLCKMKTEYHAYYCPSGGYIYEETGSYCECLENFPGGGGC